jgi:type I restriction enzyme S subunit
LGSVPTKGRVFGSEILVNSTGTGTLGRVALLPRVVGSGQPCFADSHVTVVRADRREADERFLAYMLGLPEFRCFIEEALSFGATKQRELSVEALRAHRIEAPEADEQRRIADFLDSECERIATLGEALREHRETASNAWLSAFEREIHQESRRKRLKHFGVRLLLGPFGSLLGADEYVDGGVPVINPVHIDWRGLSPDPGVAVDLDTAERLDRYRLRTGDVVLARRGELGRAAAVAEDEQGFLCGTGAAIVRNRSQLIEPAFLVLALMTERGRSHLELTAVGSTMPNLNGPELLEMDLPNWSVEAQRGAVALAGRACDASTQLDEELRQLAATLTEYRDALITEAVTGKLDVTHVSEQRMDESARAAMEGEPPEVLSA